MMTEEGIRVIKMVWDRGEVTEGVFPVYAEPQELQIIDSKLPSAAGWGHLQNASAATGEAARCLWSGVEAFHSSDGGWLVDVCIGTSHLLEFRKPSSWFQPSSAPGFCLPCLQLWLPWWLGCHYNPSVRCSSCSVMLEILCEPSCIIPCYFCLDEGVCSPLLYVRVNRRGICTVKELARLVTHRLMSQFWISNSY